MTNKLTIGKLAEAAGVGVETIRFYEKRGLLVQPEKPLSGFREYPENSINRIQFIRRAKQLGFTLDEILALLHLDTNQCQATRQLAQEKRAEIARQAEQLQAMLEALDELINDCVSTTGDACPVIEKLEGKNNKKCC